MAMFFATNDDLLQIASWLIEMPGVTLVEPYSRPGLPNRRFTTVEDVARLLQEPGWNLAAWDESTGGRPRPEFIEFSPDTQRRFGARGRTRLVSPAFIGVGRNNDQNGCLANSSLGWWTEKGARQRSAFAEAFLNEVDWPALQKAANRLQRRIGKAAPAKLRSYPIMGDAFEKMRGGKLELWNWGAACAYPSPLVTQA